MISSSILSSAAFLAVLATHGGSLGEKNLQLLFLLRRKGIVVTAIQVQKRAHCRFLQVHAHGARFDAWRRGKAGDNVLKYSNAVMDLMLHFMHGGENNREHGGMVVRDYKLEVQLRAQQEQQTEVETKLHGTYHSGWTHAR